MTNQEVLQKAIEKAMRNGYNFPGDGHTSQLSEIIEEGKHYPEAFGCFSRGMITDKYFAKAFWKDEIQAFQCPQGCDVKVDDQGTVTTNVWYGKGFCSKCGAALKEITWNRGNWKKELQQMVISEDPIKYLEQFI